MAKDTAKSELDSVDSAANAMRRSVVSLGAVNAIDMAIQILLPMVLVRVLSESDFGQFRTLWLLSGTFVGVLAMAVPASLFYFLPRHSLRSGSIYLKQAACYMVFAGLLAGLLTLAWTAWQGVAREFQIRLALFVGLWVFASLLDVLFSAQKNVPRQALINLTFALLRPALIVGAALMFRSWTLVLTAHLILVALKALACLVSVTQSLSSSPDVGAVPQPTRPAVSATLIEQIRYCAPFGASTGLYLMRGRLDQWLVASSFSVSQFGLYSIAAVFVPIQGLIRSTVNQVVLPEMNRMESEQNHAQMLQLNQRGNIAVAFLMFPILAFLALWAEQILTVLFTADYRSAAPIVQIYCALMLFETIEVTMILTAKRQGKFMMGVDAVGLLISVSVSLLGARIFGLPGAALGGLVGTMIAQGTSFWRCRQLMKTEIKHLQAWSALFKIAIAASLSVAVSAVCLRNMEIPSTLLTLLLAGLLTFFVNWLMLHLTRLGSQVRMVFGDRFAKFTGFRS